MVSYGSPGSQPWANNPTMPPAKQGLGPKSLYNGCHILPQGMLYDDMFVIYRIMVW